MIVLRNSLNPDPDSRSSGSGSGLRLFAGSGSGFNCKRIRNTAGMCIVLYGTYKIDCLSLILMQILNQNQNCLTGTKYCFLPDCLEHVIVHYRWIFVMFLLLVSCVYDLWYYSNTISYLTV